MRRQIQKHARWVAAILGLAFIAVVMGGYILSQQHLANPFSSVYKIRAEFSATGGLTPGLTQPANVAGVRVGTITDAELRGGRSLVTMEIDPGKLKHVYRDAHATLVPRTPLKDMQVEIAPGTRAAGVLPANGIIPIARTAPPVDTDELTAALDADTRDFFDILVGSSDVGTRGRGKDINRLLKALAPTAREFEEVGGALAARRHELTRLVHNLAVLSHAAGAKDRQLASLVSAANATTGALARQETELGSAVEKLPGTLSAARRSLGHATSFANALGPTLTALEPGVRELPATLRSVRPLVRAAEPILRTQLRPFVRAFLPLVKGRGATSKLLTTVVPHLTSVFNTLNEVGNELAYNPAGDNEGFLYWFAWATSNAASMLSTQDANGAMWRGLALVSCDSLTSQPGLATFAKLLLGPLPVCPSK